VGRGAWPPAGRRARTRGPAERGHVVRNAGPGDPPPLPREHARDLLRVPEGRFHVGWVGRVTPEKGADVLLEAVGALGDLSLVASVLGDGPARPQLEALAVRRGVAGRFRWLGNRPDAGRLFSAFDGFVLSSRPERTEIALLEAMA